METIRNSLQGQYVSKTRIFVFSLFVLIFAYFILASYYKVNFTTPVEKLGHANTIVSLCTRKNKAGCKVENSTSEVIHKDSNNVVNIQNSKRSPIHAPNDNNTLTTTARRKAIQKRTQTMKESSIVTNIISEYHSKGPDLRKKFNCTALFCGDVKEANRTIDYLRGHKQDKSLSIIPDTEAVKMFTRCDVFKSIRGYAQTARTDEEENFPIAYVILIHKGFEQTERLVRTLYHPQNVFCIHVDLKSPASLYRAVDRFASCFPNVYVASTRYNVTYAHVTRLLADIQCMKDLSKLKHTWRYLVTMAGTEFPLRTNKDKVDIFTNMHGINEIREAYSIRIESRYKYRHYPVNGRMKKTLLQKAPAPHGITIVKGRASNAFSRAFVDWFYQDKMAMDLLAWSNDTHSPDEHYWGTLNNLYHNPFLKTPGGYPGHPDTKGYFASFNVWLNKDKSRSPPCHGRNRHNICVFNSADLPVLRDRMHLCVNKFDLEDDPIAFACMEELLEYRENHPKPLDLRRYTQKMP